MSIGALLALNSATFGYVVSIERRLTRLETIDELVRRVARLEAVLEPRLIAGYQALDEGAEQRLEIIARAESLAHEQAELADRPGALGP